MLYFYFLNRYSGKIYFFFSLFYLYCFLLQDETEQEPEQDPNKTDDPALGAEDHGKTHHDTDNVEISELAHDTAPTGETEQKEVNWS